jgi:hypothetical protein
VESSLAQFAGFSIFGFKTLEEQKKNKNEHDNTGECRSDIPVMMTIVVVSVVVVVVGVAVVVGGVVVVKEVEKEQEDKNVVDAILACFGKKGQACLLSRVDFPVTAKIRKRNQKSLFNPKNLLLTPRPRPPPPVLPPPHFPPLQNRLPS